MRNAVNGTPRQIQRFNPLLAPRTRPIRPRRRSRWVYIDLAFAADILPREIGYRFTMFIKPRGEQAGSPTSCELECGVRQTHL
jgi:hypothetical protein